LTLRQGEQILAIPSTTSGNRSKSFVAKTTGDVVKATQLSFRSAATRHNPFMPISVLVVERDALTRETITYMLDTMKYAAVAVDSGGLALQVLDSVGIDVAVIRLWLGDPDGSALAGELKARQQSIKVIVVSGRKVPAKLTPFVDAFVQNHSRSRL
jgi:CheY-like chemotaxis protein